MPVVKRNVSAYLSDPMAGQRNVALEAKAAGAMGQQIGHAISTGVTQLGETLAKVGADTEFAKATSEFMLLSDDRVMQLKSGPLVRPKDRSTINGREVEWHPAYNDMPGSYQAAMLGERDRLLKMMTSTDAKSRFTAKAATIMSSAYKTVQTYALQKQVMHRQSQSVETLNTLQTHGEVDQWQFSDANRWLWDAQSAQNLAQARHKVLAETTWTARILDAVERDEISALEDVQTLLEEGTDVTGKDDPSIKYIDRDALWKEAEKHIKRIKSEKKEQVETHVNRIYLDIAVKPDEWSEDRIEEYAQRWAGVITPTQINTLKDAYQAFLEGPMVDNLGVLHGIKENFSRISVRDIAINKTLTRTTRATLIQEKLEYDAGLRRWDDVNNPSGPVGYYALQRLKRAYRVSGKDPLGMDDLDEFDVDDKNWQAFNTAYNELEDLMLAEKDHSKRGQQAMDWVKNHIREKNDPTAGDDAELTKATGNAAVVVSETSGKAPVTTTNYDAKAFYSWQKRHTRESLGLPPSILPMTVTSVLAMPKDSQVRKMLLGELVGMGFKFTDEDYEGVNYGDVDTAELEKTIKDWGDRFYVPREEYAE